MKHLLLLCIAMGMGLMVSAQSIARQANTNGGSVASFNGNTISYSIGQSVVSTVKSDNLSLTQGFQQSDAKSATGVIDFLAEGVYSVYPNPSTGLFTVELDSSEAIEGQIEIYNVIGQSVAKRTLESSSTHNLDFDLKNVSSGVHIVTLKSKSGQVLFSQNILIQL